MCLRPREGLFLSAIRILALGPLKNELLRRIPSVNELIESDALKSLLETHPRAVVVDAARKSVAEIRDRIKESGETALSDVDISIDGVARIAAGLAETSEMMNLRRIINATGIILHTGLGRAVLSEKARDALSEITKSYSSLEIDLETGERGRRDSNVIDLLCGITGAESATVVNNNAAATMLILRTLAQGKEVIVSRGQLVEIGGSFRIPDVMRESGATLVEVGATNKTHLRDYRNAITDNTGLLLHVHMSNYRIVGFTKQVPVGELVELGREFGIPVVDDLGSGAFTDYRKFGLEGEPLVQTSVRTGADAICFSGDKLLGGPQAGIILGKKNVIEKIRKNPLARAVRVGKLTLAALEATLRLIRDPETLAREHVVFRMLSMPKDEIKRRAEKLAKIIRKALPKSVRVELEDGASQVGGGTLPTDDIPTVLIAVRPGGTSLDDITRQLRLSQPALMARIQHDALLLDLRTVQEWEEAEIAGILEEVFSKRPGC